MLLLPRTGEAGLDCLTPDLTSISRTSLTYTHCTSLTISILPRIMTHLITWRKFPVSFLNLSGLVHVAVGKAL